MHFVETEIPGAWLVQPVPFEDPRGSFARTFCVEEFAAARLETRFVQHSISSNLRRGTLRGMHFQQDPHGEVKLVSCIRGAIRDVIVDMRPSSPTYLRWQGFDLDPRSRRQLYIPIGIAHGFQTLTDDTEVHYLISEFYTPAAATGFRYDDPAVEIAWPMAPSVISERDLAWPPLPAVVA